MRFMLASMLLLGLLIGCAGGQTMNSTVADVLDEHAQFLREKGSIGQANEVAANAEKMRESDRARLEAQAAFEQGRPYDTSFSLGFDPYAALRDYAAELRAAGRTAEAQEADALAMRYRAEQMANARQIMRQ